MNRSILVGRLTKDPELRTIANGTPTTSFTVAVNRPFTNQSGEREADFINVVVWRKQAENVAKYCVKGSLVGVEGRIQTRSYDAQDGTKRYVTEVVADSVTFLSSKSENTRGGMSYQDAMPNYEMGDENPIQSNGSDVSDDPFKEFGSEVSLSDDDLPF